jgi:phosphoglycerol transferase MdoB-like AlkP superfamily enzyme
VVSTTGGQIDFLPTVLNVLGIKNEYITFGHDLINCEEGFVASQTFMDKGAFIDNHVVFQISRDGVFENSTAYDRDTHEPVDIEQCRAGYERAIREINLSKKTTETDMLRFLLDELRDNTGLYERN